MVLRGELSDMMLQIAPQIYRPYVKMDKMGTHILHVRFKKAIYGLLRSSLLFYRKMCGKLEACGFKIDPYDPYMGKKMVTTDTVVTVIDKKVRIIRNKNGSKKMCKMKEEKQITVIWHVDDLMMSSDDNFELTKFSCYLANIYRPKLAMHLGNKHDYLGMDFEFMNNGSLEVSMFKYLDSIIDELLELITGKAETPAADHLSAYLTLNRWSPPALQPFP